MQCWAYNKSGVRCEEVAGHPGDHTMSVRWTDEECFSPIVHQLPEPKRSMYTDPGWDEPEAADAACLVCDHPMHKRMCPIDTCDCKAGIPK